MNKIIAAVLGVFVVIIMVNCAKQKPLPGERILGVKAKLYDVERNIKKMEAQIDTRTGVTKAVRDSNAAVKRAIESDRRELTEIQKKLDGFAHTTGSAMNKFILEVELSADILVKKVGSGIDDFDERQDE